jgi:phage-related protein
MFLIDYNIIYDIIFMYKVKFYKDSISGFEPVLNYLQKIDNKSRQKINKYIDFLRQNNGYLSEPYSKHISGKIRELRVDFFVHHHRIFYFSFLNKTIILLYAFKKNTKKTPKKYIKIAFKNYLDAISNSQIYD